ncbi:MAG: hypothetical protein EHM55_01790 [Acidobacteria bacterium]|nr:MAG: hypothetical protein EHM55_01790 [Acidobacteriota bacterium]
MTKSYSLHSCLAVVSAWPELMAAIHARLELFAVEPSAAYDVELAFQPADIRLGEDTVAPAGRRVYDFPDGEVTYLDEGDRLTIRVGDRVRAVCEPAAGRARIFVESPQESDLYLLSHPVLSLLLMELLKRRGYYPLHAAGLALDGHGVLLAGTSGAGKSTLSVALARRGFSFLSDDTVFLEADAPGWRIRAFPDQIDLCADTLDLFPELQGLADAELPPGWRKRQIRAETVYAAPISWDVRPRTLIFPSVCGTPTSAIRPLSREAALFELAPNVLLTDAAASQQHLDALAGVISQCTCYRLDTGRDLDDAVDVVRSAMAS